ncbi:UBX5 (YDR330W) [Zygosaccharomyces parabailii]|uniref:ZYBA0S03-01860g1_1 n=1 Tax=Zygosaccharomyces bailii (strain CLIB 213 / ATCC 58445 / CBS 680 / BCRC 21525 / NBRC 1098 / NCYC 1416 / NRRL Y-2227) TaxID=1333698 RepID=A0A8J2T686_ZYGB2|nr:UBX5 (YDR330W) [Zygosaccharomyces parabailii]CDF88784.1 ZYBA0S03-01860g1_1 [Zygosaccharomyces bailii CLIB 213]CDH15872.1 related to UBX domain-containing protein 5 [Zygosaccharomyces bailii ISA1307]SJM82765.1 related to UBX domain-containing protein 5 [Zygosaccharomyces bailii]
MSDQVANFMAITGAENDELAEQFIDMAGGDLDTAISLFFEHGGNSQLQAGAPRDDELAQSLQNEAYNVGDDFIRPPDQARHETLAETHVFPGTFGGYGGPFQHLRGVRDMFDDSRPSGVFNQRLGEDMSGSDSDSTYSEDDEEAPQEFVEEPVVELDEDGGVREYTRMVPRTRNLSKEERLAELFRPPFEMITKRDLDGARSKAKKKNKWIMINVQDSGIFQCQALNRDLWSFKEVKRLIKSNFVFLQYQFDSRNAQPYINFYGLKGKDDLPHIAILDPLTGERLKQWNRTVPSPEAFIEEINEFLRKFSLDPKASNPTVKEPTPELDPTTLTEEQQMELAIKKSLGSSDEQGKEQETAKHQIPDKVNPDPATDEKEDLFKTIQAIPHDEPPNKPGVTTRIQVRTGDGRRFVRRFNTEDVVRTIYEVVKSQIDGFHDVRFTLGSHQREDLIDKLAMTIEDAGLKNSSLLLEKTEEE